MAETQSHFLGADPRNRPSFLHTVHEFVAAAAAHSEARWILFATGGEPLARTSHVRRTTKLATLPTSALRDILGPEPLFGQGLQLSKSFAIPAGERMPEMEAARIHGPRIVLLSVLDKTPDDELPNASNGYAIAGAPYLALDVQVRDENELNSLAKAHPQHDVELEFVEPFGAQGDFEAFEARC